MLYLLCVKLRLEVCLMNIILEGLDGSGKTTLANKLSTELDMYVHHSPFPCDDEVLKEWQFQMLKHEPGIILDRCFISELIYGPALRGNVIYSSTDFISALTLLLINNIVVICMPPLDIVKKNLVGTEDEKLLPHVDNLYLQLQAVICLLQWASVPHLYYDYTKDDPQYLIDMVKSEFWKGWRV